jgi:hypothetical protein
MFHKEIDRRMTGPIEREWRMLVGTILDGPNKGRTAIMKTSPNGEYIFLSVWETDKKNKKAKNGAVLNFENLLTI